MMSPSITQPLSGTVVRTPQLQVQGHAPAGALVRVALGGRVVATAHAAASGSFATLIRLAHGINTIVAETGSGSGQLRSDPVLQIYQPPPTLPNGVRLGLVVLVIGLAIGWASLLPFRHHQRTVLGRRKP
jgi:hypothetical protein